MQAVRQTSVKRHIGFGLAAVVFVLIGDIISEVVFSIASLDALRVLIAWDLPKALAVGTCIGLAATYTRTNGCLLLLVALEAWPIGEIISAAVAVRLGSRPNLALFEIPTPVLALVVGLVPSFETWSLRRAERINSDT